jgi:hypothetical protein
MKPREDQPPMTAESQRQYDAAGLTVSELERTRRELAASLALARPGSPARAPIQAQMAAIDAELAAAGYTSHLNDAGPLLGDSRHDHLTPDLSSSTTSAACFVDDMDEAVLGLPCYGRSPAS